MEIYDAELFAIAQTTQWGLNNNIYLYQHLWIFSDNQATIKRLNKTSPAPGQVLANQIFKNTQMLLERGCQVHIFWVPGHQGVFRNEKANQLAKDSLKLPRTHPQTYTSQAFIKAQIQAQVLANW